MEVPVSRNRCQDADQQLVRAVLDGDPEAQQSLLLRLGCVERNLEFRLRHFRRHRGPIDRDDLRQEVLVRILRDLRRYRGEASLETWAAHYCRRVFLEFLRERARCAGRGPLPEPVHEDPDPDLDGRELLAAALHGLPELEARVIDLHLRDGASLPQVGCALALPLGTVKSHYYRALERLRTRVSPELAP